MRVSRTLVVAPLLGAALFFARPLAAQSPAPSAYAHEYPAFQPHPSALLAPAPVHEAETPPNTGIYRSNRPHAGEAVALMIAGAAGIVTGLIIDEPIITVAGAAAAGVGLYLYIR
jgi:hypothetical protein